MFDGRLPSQPVPPPGRESDLGKRLEAYINRLSEEARRRVEKRASVEARWLEDLRQFHGIYDSATTGRLIEAEASQVFINLTATKTEAMEARLWDLLFPTDDRNWGIGPTPVPELTEGAEAALEQADEAGQAVDQNEAAMQEAAARQDVTAAAGFETKMRQAEAVQNEALAAADRLHAALNEAKRRANLMQEEIDDQFITCNLPAEARDAIGDGCKIGFGVLKGPVLGERPKKRWREVETIDQAGNTVVAHELTVVADDQPAAYRVDPWSFFPDPDASRVEDCEGFFERHPMNKGKLRKLAQRPDIDKNAVRALLEREPEDGGMPTYVSDLHAITGQTNGSLHDRYIVWEYTGPIDADDLKLMADAFDDEALLDDLEDADPLIQWHAKVWFCQGKALSFALHPLDSGDPIYSVFTIRKDEASLFGFGIPYIMRHPQSVLNGAYRMMMDNSGLGTGPQLIVNTDMVTPQDGQYRMKSRKVWLRNSTASIPGVPAFETFDIPTHQAELANIIALGSQTIDEVTAMPAIAQGEQGASVTKTAQGMALLMNSANVSFRRIVKNYDDDMTIPLIKRFYDWNMQFSPKAEIKGDYEVQARGSSVLLVREMQAQNLLLVAQLFGDHPVYGPMLKHGDLLRQIFRAHMIAADEIVKSDREFKEWQQEQEASGQGDPAMAVAQLEAELQREEMMLRREEMQAKTEIANMENDARVRTAQINYDATMAKVAETLNMSRDALDTKLAQTNAMIGAKERGLAAEVAMQQRTGISSGGAV